MEQLKIRTLRETLEAPVAPVAPEPRPGALAMACSSNCNWPMFLSSSLASSSKFWSEDLAILTRWKPSMVTSDAHDGTPDAPLPISLISNSFFSIEPTLDYFICY